MKLLFEGDLEGLGEGISLLSEELGLTVEEGGYTFTARRVSEPTLAVRLEAGKGEIVYQKRCHFYRALGLAAEQLREEHMKNWFSLYKAFGWDVMDMRHGSLLARVRSAIVEIKAYLDGTLPRIEELEEERLYYNITGGSVTTNNYGNVVSPSRIDYKVI